MLVSRVLLFGAVFLIATHSTCGESDGAVGVNKEPAIKPMKAKLSSDGKPIIKLPAECSYYQTLLALDGGGMKGIITSQVLKKITNSIKKYLLKNQDVLAMEETTRRLVTKDDFHIDIADYFDAIAGISAGSWVATYLASKGKASESILKSEHIVRRFGEIRPGSAEALDVFFLEYGIYIYPPRLIPVTFRPQQLKTWRPQVAAVTCSQYRPNGLEWVLDKFLGDTKMSQLDRSLLVTAVDLNIRSTIQFSYDAMTPSKAREKMREFVWREIELNDCVKLLHQLEAEGKETEAQELVDKCNEYTTYPELKTRLPTVRTGNVWTRTIPRNASRDEDFEEPGIKYSSGMDYYLKDIARASSAFPIVHPAKNIKPLFDVAHEYDLIDGAMVLNNPTLQALIWLSSNPSINLTDIATISIGSGTAASDYSSAGTGGFLQWVGPIVSLLLVDSPEFVQANLDYMFYGSLRHITISGQYLRIQAVGVEGTPENVALASGTDATLLPELMTIGKDLATRFEANIDHFVEYFIFTKCTDARYKLIEKIRTGRQERYFEQAKDAFKAATKSYPPPQPSTYDVNILDTVT